MKKIVSIVVFSIVYTHYIFSQSCLIADFPFNGNGNDVSGNGNNATLIGNPISSSGYDGSTGSAYFFDAVDDALEVSGSLGNFGTNDFTISLWINTELQSGSARFLSKREVCISGNTWFSLAFDDGVVVFETSGNNEYRIIIGNTIVNDGNWHHVAVVREGAEYTLYVDCNEEGSFTTTFVHNMTNNTPLTIGNDVCTDFCANCVKYTGLIDNVKMFDCGLSSSELSNLCRSQLCLIADFPFNGNGNDVSGNGNNATLIGNPISSSGYDGSTGSAYFFDAVDDALEVSGSLGNFGTNDFTISLWINTELQSGSARFLSKREVCISGNTWFSLAFDDGVVVFETSGNNEYRIIIGNTIVNDGNWHHVAVVREGAEYTLYVDCNEEGSFTTTFVHNMTNNTPLTIGNDVCTDFCANCVKYTGLIDNVKMFDCGLSSSELNNLCSIPVGITAKSHNFNFELYPNPTNNTIVIEAKGIQSNIIQYQIFNSLGTEVVSQISNSENFSVDINNLPSGSYFICLKSKDAMSVKKFIKN